MPITIPVTTPTEVSAEWIANKVGWNMPDSEAKFKIGNVVYSESPTIEFGKTFIAMTGVIIGVRWQRSTKSWIYLIRTCQESLKEEDYWEDQLKLVD